MSQNPGTRNFRLASTTRAAAGTFTERAGPALTIRLPRMMTVWSSLGVESVPSITVTCVIARLDWADAPTVQQATRDRTVGMRRNRGIQANG